MGAATATNLSINGGNIAGWTINQNSLNVGESEINSNGTFCFRYYENNQYVGFVKFYKSLTNYKCILQIDGDLMIGSHKLTESDLAKLLKLAEYKSELLGSIGHYGE
jgi:hypothetical protein